MDRSACLLALRDASARLATAVEGDRDAAVVHCPGWSNDELAAHLGDVQFFWADVLERKVQAYDDVRRPTGPPEGQTPTDYLRTQADRLVRQLEATSDSDPIWTWFAPDQTVGWVVCRQMIEAAIHAWDAEHAIGRAQPLPADVAVVGVREFVEVMANDVRDGAPIPRSVKLEPREDEWRGTIHHNAGEEVPLAGAASDILLTLWGRRPASDPRVAAALEAIDLS